MCAHHMKNTGVVYQGSSLQHVEKHGLKVEPEIIKMDIGKSA